MKFPKLKMRSGYRCFLYEAAVFVAAVSEMKRKPLSSRHVTDIGARQKQVALEATLCKLRSVIDFFTKEGVRTISAGSPGCEEG